MSPWQHPRCLESAPHSFHRNGKWAGPPGGAGAPKVPPQPFPPHVLCLASERGSEQGEVGRGGPRAGGAGVGTGLFPQGPEAGRGEGRWVFLSVRREGLCGGSWLVSGRRSSVVTVRQGLVLLGEQRLALPHAAGRGHGAGTGSAAAP